MRHRNLDQKDLPLTNDLGGAAIETGQVGWDADRWHRDRFEKIVLPHLDAAYSLARWLTRNDADAGDVVQEASLRAFLYFAEFCGEVAIASIDAEILLESRSELRRLDQLIEALPAPLRETIVLRELHELGYREIAEVTGVPIGTVMSRLYRARSLLLRVPDGAPGASTALSDQQVRVRAAGDSSGEPGSLRVASI